MHPPPPEENISIVDKSIKQVSIELLLQGTAAGDHVIAT